VSSSYPTRESRNRNNPVRVERPEKAELLGDAAAAFCLVLALSAVLLGAAPEPKTTETGSFGRFAVASEDETTTRAALAVLHSGGSAVDAAVTAALVAGVASPSSSGIGGGGFALVWSSKDKKVTALDFREIAPRALDVAAFERRPFPSAERGKTVGVPGEVAGLVELQRTFGKKSWAEVVQPAVRAAAQGFPVGAHLASVLGWASPQLAVDSNLAALFAPGGRPATAGNIVKNPTLSRTLAKVAAEGKRALYEGAIADDLVASAGAAGSGLVKEDFAAYHTAQREPLHVAWNGLDVYTMGAPSAGGLLLAETLGLFSREEVKGFGLGTGAYQHVLAEAMRGALADRMKYVSDPDQDPVDLGKLLARERLARRRATIAIDRTHWIPRFTADEHGTHHIVTADADGNVVSLTTTVNRAFGAVLSGKKTGIVLNDELEDFTPSSAGKALGIAQVPNRARPGARPVSSMTPTIVVKDGTPILALGGSGGMAIAPNVTQALLARLVFGETPERSVGAPRFNVPTEGSTIAVDPASAQDLRADLERRGEVVSTHKFFDQAVQMIAFEDGKKIPAADPRKHGSAMGE
jgi:gamma-glutamyltranspeptidase/glutathione hydrolase